VTVWQEGKGGGGERAMACGRIAEVVLLIYDFLTLSNSGEYMHSTGGEGGEGREGGMRRGVEVEGWSRS